MWTEQGGGGFRKNHVCPHGGREGLEACPRGQKCFMDTHFARMNSNAALLVFEQLHNEFLEYTPPPFLNKNGSTGTDYNFNVKPYGDMFSTQYNQI